MNPSPPPRAHTPIPPIPRGRSRSHGDELQEGGGRARSPLRAAASFVHSGWRRAGDCAPYRQARVPRDVSSARGWLTALLLSGCVVLCGCRTTYIPPSGRADFSAIASAGASLRESFAAAPAAVFPASIVAVRVQAPRYRSYFTEREGGVFGQGRYAVVTVSEFEEEADFQRLARLPGVGGFINLSRLLLPQTLESDRELREAAARLKADMLLLYTLDTSFYNHDASIALNVITLGLSPTRRVFVRATASALLIDTRTGFIYAAFEANAKRDLRTNAWESREAADRARRDIERTAFNDLVGEFESHWPLVLQRAKQGA